MILIPELSESHNIFVCKVKESKSSVQVQGMASITMAASLLGSSAGVVISKQPSTTGCRGGVTVAKASEVSTAQGVSLTEKDKVEAAAAGSSCSGRRKMVFMAAAAAVAACTVARDAMADEPKAGTPEAKKKYAPICVTMPTARICHK